jgi:outer membrane protein TolC
VSNETPPPNAAPANCRAPVQAATLARLPLLAGAISYTAQRSSAAEPQHSRRAAVLAKTRYSAGYLSNLDFVDAQRTELGNERATVQLAAQRPNVSVALIKALVEGWSVSVPPAAD